VPAPARLTIAHGRRERSPPTFSILRSQGQALEGQFEHSLKLLEEVQAPLERAETQLRAGQALVQVGRRAEGLDRLADACRAARNLRGGLTRRELE
jgi:hypothetical protein